MKTVEEITKELITNGVKKEWIKTGVFHLEEIADADGELNDYFQERLFDEEPSYNIYFVDYKIVGIYGEQGVEVIVWIEEEE